MSRRSRPTTPGLRYLESLKTPPADTHPPRTTPYSCICGHRVSEDRGRESPRSTWDPSCFSPTGSGVPAVVPSLNTMGSCSYSREDLTILFLYAPGTLRPPTILLLLSYPGHPGPTPNHLNPRCLLNPFVRNQEGSRVKGVDTLPTHQDSLPIPSPVCDRKSSIGDYTKCSGRGTKKFCT